MATSVTYSVDRRTIIALSVMAGIGVLQIDALSDGFTSLFTPAFSNATPDPAAIDRIVRIHFLIGWIATGVAGIVTGWWLAAARTLKWGLTSLILVGGVEAAMYIWQRFRMARFFGADEYPFALTITEYFAFLIPALLVAGMVVAGALMRHVRQRRLA